MKHRVEIDVGDGLHALELTDRDYDEIKRFMDRVGAGVRNDVRRPDIGTGARRLPRRDDTFGQFTHGVPSDIEGDGCG